MQEVFLSSPYFYYSLELYKLLDLPKESFYTCNKYSLLESPFFFANFSSAKSNLLPYCAALFFRYANSSRNPKFTEAFRKISFPYMQQSIPACSLHISFMPFISCKQFLRAKTSKQYLFLHHFQNTIHNAADSYRNRISFSSNRNNFFYQYFNIF